MSKMSYFFDILLFCVLIAKNVVLIRHFIPDFQHQNVENVELIRHFHHSEMVEVQNLENFQKKYEHFLQILYIYFCSKATLEQFQGQNAQKIRCAAIWTQLFFALRSKKAQNVENVVFVRHFPLSGSGPQNIRNLIGFPPPPEVLKI